MSNCLLHFGNTIYVSTNIRETSFLLFYGDDVFVPLELDIPYLRISLHRDIPNEDARKEGYNS